MTQTRQLVVLISCAAALLLAVLLVATGPASNADVTTVTLPQPAGPSPTTAPTFESSIARLNAKQRKWSNGETWHKGCPVKLKKLRLLQVSSYDFTGVVVTGRVVAHAKAADDLVHVFRKLFENAFQIEQLDTRELYPPDQRPDLDNPSVSFNCRKIAGSSSWSQHAYGLAIDLNPVQNPYVDGKEIIPPEGKDYVDRSLGLPGMIVRGDTTVGAFNDIGWGWGGKWKTKKDYMHFSSTGG